MRYGLIVLILLLAACGAEPAPVTTPEAEATQPEAATSEAVVPTQAPQPTSEPPQPQGAEALATNPPSILDITPVAIVVTQRPTIPGELPFEGVGTLVTSPTEDPDAGLPFNWISLYRRGGPPNPDGSQRELFVRIFADGRIVRGNTEGRVVPGLVDLLNLYIREMNFFGAQGTFIGPLGDDDITTFLYTVTVSRGDLEVGLNGMEGFMPPEFERIITTILLEAQKLPG